MSNVVFGGPIEEDRVEYVGRTMVIIDGHLGPIKFWRDGVEVGCVCDLVTGVVCQLHAR